MSSLDDLKPGIDVRGIILGKNVTIIATKWHGTDCVEITYKDSEGNLGEQLIDQDQIENLEIQSTDIPWSFNADGNLLRLVSEAYRIYNAHLFDPHLAIHTSLLQPLPHQITAVYKEMLQRQPLRFLLADDPGAGKTIMAGLFIKELMIRGDLKRCVIVCPGMLVEQWQDELYKRFNMNFDIMTNDKFEAAASGNWFNETNLCLCRLDKLSRDDLVQEKLHQTEWDLIVVDEAHKMSATYFGGKVRYTKRYHLGRLLSGLTRHLLLMTATPHNGKEADFQLFMALLDGDRFEGGHRDACKTDAPRTHDVTDLMRRVVKEELLKFDGSKLFPERRAYTVNYPLSDLEAALYARVTDYVKEEFNRADKLDSDKRKGNIGFALTTLQRRLASSPEAIYQSIKRRVKRLEKRLREEKIQKRGHEVDPSILLQFELIADYDLDDLEDAPDEEVLEAENQIVDQSTAARTIQELEAEIATLHELETLAHKVRMSGTDRKWTELSNLLQETKEMFDNYGNRRKLVIFTEHLDTLRYITEKIRTLIGKPEAVVNIHGRMLREDRKKAEGSFTQDKDTLILVATDAAGEGINLQRAHLMVNYDMPWNPNRIEQRFGRIHRIGQEEVCHLWNLVSNETREGDVFKLLLDKLEIARKALGGSVFDVIGRIFQGNDLKQLLIDAIRYGDQPEVKSKIHQKVDNAANQEQVRKLIEERALAHDHMNFQMVNEIREEMERAEARRLQPHYIESFFIEAFKHLGGRLYEREPKRFEITRVPSIIIQRDRLIGTREYVQKKYERITFEKDLITVQGKPSPAEYIIPSHPLLNAVIDLILERYRDLMRQGSIFVKNDETVEDVRALFYLQNAIHDARIPKSGEKRIVSRRMQFVEIDSEGNAYSAGYAPYLDYEPITDEDKKLIEPILEEQWLNRDLEEMAKSYAVTHLIPKHFEEIKKSREELILKTMAAVHERLTSEIMHWDHRAETLKDREQAGKQPRMNWQKARDRADELKIRLETRIKELEQERLLSKSPPVVIGGALVVTRGLLNRLRNGEQSIPGTFAKDKKRIELMAMNSVMDIERKLGYEPIDVSSDNCGWDIESKIPDSGKLRFIEVKGRITGATTVTVSKNEILAAFNQPDNFILALVEVDGEETIPRYVRKPFKREPDFGVTSVNYNLLKLLASAEEPN